MFSFWFDLLQFMKSFITFLSFVSILISSWGFLADAFISKMINLYNLNGDNRRNSLGTLCRNGKNWMISGKNFVFQG
jgi:hypothetical protein